jgi:hypothetical protein
MPETRNIPLQHGQEFGRRNDLVEKDFGNRRLDQSKRGGISRLQKCARLVTDRPFAARPIARWDADEVLFFALFSSHFSLCTLSIPASMSAHTEK